MAHSAKPPRDQVQQNSSRGIVNYSGQMRAIDVEFSAVWTAIYVTGYPVKKKPSKHLKNSNNNIWLLRIQPFAQCALKFKLIPI